MPSPLPPTELLFLSVKAQLKGHHVDSFTNKHKNSLHASCCVGCLPGPGGVLVSRAYTPFLQDARSLSGS